MDGEWRARARQRKALIQKIRKPFGSKRHEHLLEPKDTKIFRIQRYENLFGVVVGIDDGQTKARGVEVGIDDGQTNGINFIPFVCPSQSPIRGERARARGVV